jgi:hypothetical protein
MRRGWLAVLVFAALGAVGLAVVAIATTTTEAFTIGVLSTEPSATIKAGQTACQKPIAVPPGGSFDRVDFEVGTYHRAGPAIDVTVAPLTGSSPVRHGVLPKGYPDVAFQQRHVVEVGRVPGDTVVEVCFHDRGPRPIALFGGNDGSATQSTGYINGRPIGFDFDLVFRRQAKSFATLLPDIARRAARFRPPWVTPGLFYALVVLLLVGVPILLARAVRAIDSDA